MRFGMCAIPPLHYGKWAVLQGCSVIGGATDGISSFIPFSHVANLGAGRCHPSHHIPHCLDHRPLRAAPLPLPLSLPDLTSR